MAYTFVDSLNKLSSLLSDGNTGADDFWPLAIRKKELNRGEWQLAVDSRDLMGYQSGVLDSSNTLTLPADWIETYNLIINNILITSDREVGLSDWENYYTYTASPPYYYYWTDGIGTPNINFIGSVDGLMYRLYYFKKPTSELSATTDMSLHQEEFRDATAYYAASELIRQIGKNQIANEYRAIYEANVIKARTWGERLYVRKNYARPDFGGDVISETDRQGHGW